MQKNKNKKSDMIFISNSKMWKRNIVPSLLIIEKFVQKLILHSKLANNF